MKHYKFVGDGPVDVDALGLVGVEPGQTVDVEDPEVAKGLDGQESWEHIPDKKRSAAAKKAAATRADEADDQAAPAKTED